MTDINKQKFLTELGKLLTFMYEEDRQLALSIYDEVFEQAEDEQAVLSALVSPTRQAVIIARAYNAKERKLQIHSQSREGEEYYDPAEDVPDFVRAIEDTVPFDFTYTPEPVSEDQISLFDEGAEVQSVDEPEDDSVVSEQTAAEEEIPVEEAEEINEEKAEENLVSEENQEAEVSEEDSQEEVPEENSQEEAPEEDSQEEVPEENSQEEVPEEDSQEEATEEESEDTEKDTEESGNDVEDKEETTEPEAQKQLSQDEKTEAFIKDFEIKPAPVEAFENEETEADAEEEDSIYTGETISKPRIFLLILYILFAVPITAVGIVLLLVPTLLALALAIAFISAGSVLLAATFSGFAVFADIMVMLGAALIVLALGLLLLWLFIWFIGGAMASLVRSVLDLAHKWCYKEVPAV